MTERPAAHWQELWRNGTTPWDQGAAHPLLTELLRLARQSGHLQDGALIWEPGCGRAHAAAYLAQQGFHVVAEDIAPEAIQTAKNLYQHPRLTLRTGDVFHVAEADQGRFDAIYDRAMLCALPPERHADFLRGCAARLKPRGLWLGIPFAAVDRPIDQGPPFALPTPALLKTLEPFFEICAIQTHQGPGTPAVVLSEHIVVALKKG